MCVKPMSCCGFKLLRTGRSAKTRIGSWATKDKITGKETIDAKGLVVAPGFIDTHYPDCGVPCRARRLPGR